jgi:hypothetical protein
MAEAVREEVGDGAVSEVTRSFIRWESPSLLARKKNGKLRKITDASQLNKYIKKIPFVMEDHRLLRSLLRRHQKGATIDVEKAYYQVPVSPALRPFLGWSFDGKTYVYNGMPFGIRSAPRTFTRIMGFCVKAIRARWKVTVLAFLDDILVLHEDWDYLENVVKQIVHFLQWLGWKINEEKSSLVPSTAFTWLGWNWDAEAMTVCLPADKRLSLLYYLRALSAALAVNEAIPVRKLASAIGKLNACRFQYPQASLFLGKLNRLKTATVNEKGWNSSVCLAGEGLEGEVNWWYRTIHANTPTPLTLRPPEATLTTDAALHGWGATLEVYRPRTLIPMHGVWDHRPRTSNNREMTAVLRALRQMTRLEATKTISSVLIRSDNTTAVYDVNRQRACDSLRPTLVRLLRFAEMHSISVTAEHVPGINNGVADALSRISASGDYGLRPAVLQSLLKEWNVRVDADLFAAGWNAQSPVFCSLRPDRKAFARNAWTVRWAEFRLPLVHPPICQIPKTLARLHQKGMRAVLIVPDWPLQPWSNQAREMATATKVLGPAEQVLMLGKQSGDSPNSLPPGSMLALLTDTRTTKGKNT